MPFLLAVLVLTFNKTTGTSTFTSYLVTIFHKSGFDGLLGNAGQFTIKIVNLLVTVFAATLVDRKGRVWLLKIGTMGMTIGLLSVGAVFTGIERFGLEPSRMTGLVTLVGFFVMQVFYALGPGICVWLVLSELMPQRIRANGMAIALFMNQLVAWGLASTFRSWIAAWGWDTMFYFFAVNGLLYFITVLFIPETKGKSLDELEHLFDEELLDYLKVNLPWYETEIAPLGSAVEIRAKIEEVRLHCTRARMSHIYRRLDPAKPAWTLTGSGGGGTHVYHWSEPRALTNPERAALQTFPQNYQFCGTKEQIRKQIGMAVPTRAARQIFQAILKTFAGADYPSLIPERVYRPGEGQMVFDLSSL